MLPVYAMSNGVDCPWADAVLRREVYRPRVLCLSDSYNFDFREFGAAVSGAKKAMLTIFRDLIGRVVRIGPKKEMLGINADTVIAAVTDMKSMGDVAVENLKRNAMRALWFSTDHDLAVALGLAGKPVPTSSLSVDLGFRK